MSEIKDSVINVVDPQENNEIHLIVDTTWANDKPEKVRLNKYGLPRFAALEARGFGVALEYYPSERRGGLQIDIDYQVITSGLLESNDPMTEEDMAYIMNTRFIAVQQTYEETGVEDLSKAEQPGSIDPALFGDMETINVNKEELLVRMMCWNIATKDWMENPPVYLSNDDEAKALAEQAELKYGYSEERKQHYVPLADSVLSVVIYDASLRLAILRAINFKHTRSDPPVDQTLGMLLHIYQQQAGKMKQDAAGEKVELGPDPA